MPSFADIARRTTDYKKLALFLTKPHGQMPDMTLSQPEIADIVAYISTLGPNPLPRAEPRPDNPQGLSGAIKSKLSRPGILPGAFACWFVCRSPASSRSAPPPPWRSRPAVSRAGKKWFARTCQNCHSTADRREQDRPEPAQRRRPQGRERAGLSLFREHEADTPAAYRGPGPSKALDDYIADPRGDVHGVKMYFKGLAKAKDRADMIAYLKTLK